MTLCHRYSVNTIYFCLVAYFGSETFDASEDDWSKSLMINVAGAGYMMGAVAPLMKETNRKELDSTLFRL